MFWLKRSHYRKIWWNAYEASSERCLLQYKLLCMYSTKFSDDDFVLSRNIKLNLKILLIYFWCIIWILANTLGWFYFWAINKLIMQDFQNNFNSKERDVRVVLFDPKGKYFFKVKNKDTKMTITDVLMFLYILLNIEYINLSF